MNILDLDDISSWKETYKRFIQNDSYWSVIERAFSQKEDDAFSNIMQGLENSIEYVESQDVLALRQKCCDNFKNCYTHVTAYHACRPTKIESYFSKGIVPANMEVLIEKAKIFFGDPDAVLKAVEDIGISYLNHGRDKIGFFISRTGSLESGYSGYLEHGSELYKSIATRLGEWAVQKVSNQGSPTLFQCSIPISWLDEFTTFPMTCSYALTPLKQLLVHLRWPYNIDRPIRGAFLLTRPVPKEFILDAIDMTPFIRQ